MSRNQLAYAERQGRIRSGTPSALPIIVLVLAGVTYNGVLAFLNANGLYVSRTMVIVFEILILSGAFLSVATSRSQRFDPVPASFLVFFIVSAVTVSLFSGGIFVEMARHAAIIALFLMLGERTTPSALHKAFLISAAIVFAFLLVEIRSLETYASIFSPATYFAQTRGIAPSEFDEYGIFGNALGWDERFSILRIIDHRAASIFLEQVSLGNFAVVMTIFLCCRWRSVSLTAKLWVIPVIALVVITTASRAALGLVLAAPLAWWLAPKLNRFATLAIMPLMLGIAFAITQTRPRTAEDNLEGRLGYTIRNLADLDLASIAGFNALEAPRFADSGYVYVIVASSIFGLLLLWLFTSLIASGRGDDLKRCSLLLNLYVFAALTVSGTSIFSIKTAALLWLLVGFMRRHDEQLTSAKVSQAAAAERDTPSRAALRPA